MTTTDVLLGGGITLAGTVVTQLVAIWVTRGQRREGRKINIAEFNRRGLDQLLDAATTYRDVLVIYHQELNDGPSVALATETRFRRAQMDYQAYVYRVDPSVTRRFAEWETIALDWAQGDAGVGQENSAWKAAVRAGGDQLRSTLRET